MSRLANSARVFFCVHASGGHSVRLRVADPAARFDVAAATAATMFVTFADKSTATWTCTLIPDAKSATFVQGVTSSSVYVDHVLVTGDLVAAQVGDAALETTITVGGQAYACTAEILPVTL